MRTANCARTAVAAIATLALAVTQLGCLEPGSASERLERLRAGRTSNVAAATRRAAPDFELTDLAGAPVRLSDHRGKVVLLNFWATWCPPCVREIPDLIALREELTPARVEVIGVSLDTAGPEVVSKFVQEHGMTYPTAIDTSGVAALYGGVTGIPTTFVIDANGGIAETIVGIRSKADFLAAVNKASKG